jgi:D-alanine-D-alanine ligase
MNRKMLKAKKIGVLLGGDSSEREVSLKSGGAVFRALESKRYNVVALDAAEDLCRLLKKEDIDIAFIALHGGDGENGALQGMLEVMKIPYTGSGVLASALAMDKEASKKIFRYHGVPSPEFLIINAAEPRVKGGGPLFPLPWVVKPAAEGSSVGVEIVKDRAKYAAAVRRAVSYGGRAVVEKYIAGKEVQIGVLNDKVLGGVEVRPSKEFYNYEAKYTAGLTEYILPPALPVRVYKKVKDAALSAHRALGCSGATRVDLIVDRKGNPFVLEVNTIPGMTETSLLPKIAKHAGYDFPGLLEEILGGAIED